MRTLRLAIIGLGPRGLSVLERTCANARECLPVGDPLEIHVVDPHVGNGGGVWRQDQSADLLMNTVASQVTMFVDESVDCVGPQRPGPSLYEWARFITLVGLPDRVPDRVRAEAARLGPDSYPSRAFYGHYLSWTLRHVIDSAPDHVSVVLHSDSVLDLRDNDDGSQRVKLATGGTIEVDAVVLTQGHLPSRMSRAEESFARFAADHRLRYVPPGNPADASLTNVAPGEVVVLRGMGLNFFDHVALLTIGRGGSFRRRADGSLAYVPSGNEPKLVAGSRRGVPYHARGENQKGSSGRYHPLFLTEDVIARFRDRADHGDPVNFRRDIWPLIDLEVRATYYSTLLRERDCGCDADLFLHNFVAIARESGTDSGSDPFEPNISDLEHKLLDIFDIGPDERWDWRDITTPYRRRDPGDTAEFRAWLRDHLVRDVVAAQQGNVRGALKAALDVLRDLRNEIRLVVDHAGLSGDSYRDDLQGWYMPLNAYLSIGPPAQRIEELVALIDAGVVELLGPKLRVQLDPDRGCFVASSGAYPDVQVAARTLIEARLPEPDLRHTTDPLLRSLLARGECRLHRIPIVGGGSYPTGGLAVTRRPYHLLDMANHSHPRRFTFGVPTETVHWITAAGIRPGVNSVILSDADAVARASLLAAHARITDGPRVAALELIS